MGVSYTTKNHTGIKLTRDNSYVGPSHTNANPRIFYIKMAGSASKSGELFKFSSISMINFGCLLILILQI